MDKVSKTPASTHRSETSRAVDRQFANTLERGLRILGCFSGSMPELGNGEIAATTGLPKPTVSRLTHTLVELGYLRRRPASARFELGTSVLSLAYPVLAGMLQFRRLATPHMAELAKAIDGTVAVALRDRMQMVNIESVTERDVLKRQPGAGLTIHFAVSTPGLAWMINAESAERERALRELAHVQPESLDAMRDEFDRCFKLYLRDGYIARHGVNRPDTWVMATALKRRPGEELLVLSCALDAPSVHAAALERTAGRKLLAAARAIDASMAQR